MMSPSTDPPRKITKEEMAAAIPDYAGRVLTLTVLDPAGTTTYPGKRVRVRLGGPLSPPDMVMVFYPGGALASTFGEVSGPNGGLIEVPPGFTGPFKFGAVGMQGEERLVTSPDVTLFIDPAAMSPPITVTKIHVEPSRVSLSGRGSVTQLRVIAAYSDGVERDVAGDGLGATYSGNSPSWVLARDGIIVGRTPGSGSVTVSHSGHSVDVDITVEDGPQVNNPPHANAGGYYYACSGEFVQLDGSTSYDLDEILGDVLTYAWDLDADGEFDDAFGKTPRVQLIFPGPYWLLGLRMTDAEGLESIDYASVEADSACVGNR
jgi:hypothetical protein